MKATKDSHKRLVRPYLQSNPTITRRMMEQLISDRTRQVAANVEEHLTVGAPSGGEGDLELELSYFDSTKSESAPIARSFVTLPWEVAKEVAMAVAEKEGITSK